MAARCKSPTERKARRKATYHKARAKRRAKNAAYQQAWQRAHPGYHKKMREQRAARAQIEIFPIDEDFQK